MPDLITYREAYEMLGISKRSFLHLIERGQLPAYRIAGLRACRVRRADVAALLTPIPAVRADKSGVIA